MSHSTTTSHFPSLLPRATESLWYVKSEPSAEADDVDLEEELLEKENEAIRKHGAWFTPIGYAASSTNDARHATTQPDNGSMAQGPASETETIEEDDDEVEYADETGEIDMDADLDADITEMDQEYDDEEIEGDDF
ncbi:uncharacterized protein VTP21DRAFT_706 [Calcarisporiella thermophila]|uniref:uncharacterized protein n=1 Tax=Calcarisporiella thermophila TaxID=911321 RepID=UPI00374239FC